MSNESLIMSVRFSNGTYTARARGEKVTASSTISAEIAARALAVKLGTELAQPDLFAASRCSADPHVQFAVHRPAIRAVQDAKNGV